MSTIVMKFGGASVATPEHFTRIADIIIEKAKHHPKVVVVVSAMGDTTDQLIALAKKVHPEPPQREFDMLVSVGERISISLLAMALSLKGCEAISFTGSQSGIITCSSHASAKIVEVRPHRLKPHLESGKVVIVAGFQGVSVGGEITTLGRGGSDTTAVALGIALDASWVEFYKDVPGVFNKDPKVHEDASFFESLTYYEALKIVEKGAKILHGRSIELAHRNNIPLQVLSFKEEVDGCYKSGTIIGQNQRERLIPPIYEK